MYYDIIKCAEVFIVIVNPNVFLTFFYDKSVQFIFFNFFNLILKFRYNISVLKFNLLNRYSFKYFKYQLSKLFYLLNYNNFNIFRFLF